MSGIAGVVFLDGRPAQEAEIRLATDAMRHRGPDGLAVWVHGPVAFGHSMFRTTPEALHDRQPLWSDQDGLAITCDARIDNRDELIGLLSIARPPAEVPDSEIILRAYATWGENCPQWLVGDFSFAIWDERSRRLFCVRDRFGVKPFCYYFLPGHLFAFASEIRGLLALPQVPRRLNEWLITELFEPDFEGFDKTATFYKDILKLEPATIMGVRCDLTEARRYWSLDASREIRLRSDQEYVDAFREIFMDAVRCRMRATGPIGVMLSGGVDSSSIVCTASRVAEGTAIEVHTFSGMAERDCPETRFIHAVIQRVPVHSHLVRSDEAGQYAEDFERAIFNAAEPVEPTRNLVTRVLYRIAQRNGIRVVMDGVDGDMMTSHGYTIPYLLKAGQWQSAISQCREVASRLNLSTWSVLRSLGLRPIAPQCVLWLWGKLRRRQDWNTYLFNKDYASRIELSKRMKLLQKEWFSLKRQVNQDQAAFLGRGILPFSYEQYDLTAASIPVEPRHPFSDNRLVEFCLGVPSEQKVCDGYRKALLRRAADVRLPDDVRWRAAKPTIGPHFMRAFLLRKRKLFEEASSHLEVISPYIDVAKLESVRRRYDRRNDPFDLYVLLSAMYLVLWLRRTSFTM